MPKENSTDFTLLPPGSIIFSPFEGHVTILFPTQEDAIVFHEFLKSFIAGEIILEAVDRGSNGNDTDFN